MKRFLSSAWFPFLMCLVLAGVTVAAYAMLKPTGEDVGNSQIVMAFQIAGWAAGPVIAMMSFIVICCMNAIRRLLRLRKVRVLHPLVALAGIGPWLVFSWIVTDEPRYTAFARAAIDFVGRPMLWGSLVACLLTAVFWLLALFPSKK